MKNLISFLKHNNLVPITLSFVLLGAGSTYAMQNPERLYATENSVVSIDNTYLVNKDLNTYSPTVRIVDVAEDEDAYYVSYDLSTIALADSVWQDVMKSQTLTVYKDDLKDHRDLGAYVTRQLSQMIDRELAQLQKTQTFEKKQVSQKQVATTHAGLVGMFMDDTTETIPPHVPPKPEPVPAPKPVEESEEEDVEDEVLETPEEDLESPEGEPANHPPEIQLLGDATVYISVGANYTDLGVRATDKEDKDVPTTVSVDGAIVEKVRLNTATTTTYIITYTATDSAGATTSLDRTVVIEEESAEEESEPAAGGGGGTGAGSGGAGSGGTEEDEAATSTPGVPAPSTPPEESGSSTEASSEEAEEEDKTPEEVVPSGTESEGEPEAVVEETETPDSEPTQTTEAADESDEPEESTPPQESEPEPAPEPESTEESSADEE